MKTIFYVLILVLTMVSCKNKTTETLPRAEPNMEEDIEMVLQSYPDNLSKIFDAHGGLEKWNEMETLEFSVEKPGGYEITTTDLKDRFALIEMPEHLMGFDGESIWIKNRDQSNFEDNPKSYYNLMFYFYAMPFVLADDGTLYAEAEPLNFEGKTYPGIQISFQDNVGESSKDEYILYYDAETYKMTWLAYTTTFGKNEKSKDWHFIHYKNWQEVEGLLLPETMVWYHVENDMPTTPEREVKFVSPMLTPVKMDIRVYSMPEGAEMIQ